MTAPEINSEPAPYGRRADGTPKRRPGRPPGARNKTPRRTSGAAAGGGSPYQQVVTAESGPIPADTPTYPLPTVDAVEGAGIDDEQGTSQDPLSSIGAGLADAFASAAGSSSTRPTSGAPRLTVAVRKDIRAKVAFMLLMPGQGWRMQDPHCGQVFIDQTDPIADALTNIICDSPDLVKWFTSGGSYMKWLELVAALQPVGMALWGHHVSHSVEKLADVQSFDPRRYPAVVPTATG